MIETWMENNAAWFRTTLGDVIVVGGGFRHRQRDSVPSGIRCEAVLIQEPLTKQWLKIEEPISSLLLAE